MDGHLRLGVDDVRTAAAQLIEQLVGGAGQVGDADELAFVSPRLRHVDNHVAVVSVHLRVAVDVGQRGLVADGTQLGAAAPRLSAHGLALLVGLDAIDVRLRVGVILSGGHARIGVTHQLNLVLKLPELHLDVGRHRHGEKQVRLVVSLAVLPVVVAVVAVQAFGGLDLHVHRLEVAHRGGYLDVVFRAVGGAVLPDGAAERVLLGLRAAVIEMVVHGDDVFAGVLADVLQILAYVVGHGRGGEGELPGS